jgi:hypothetical protein
MIQNSDGQGRFDCPFNISMRNGNFHFGNMQTGWVLKPAVMAISDKSFKTSSRVVRFSLTIFTFSRMAASMFVFFSRYQ